MRQKQIFYMGTDHLLYLNNCLTCFCIAELCRMDNASLCQSQQQHVTVIHMFKKQTVSVGSYATTSASHQALSNISEGYIWQVKFRHLLQRSEIRNCLSVPTNIANRPHEQMNKCRPTLFVTVAILEPIHVGAKPPRNRTE